MISNDQKNLNSGFGAKSEPSEILDGINLSGKTAIVTGGYSCLLYTSPSPRD